MADVRGASGVPGTTQFGGISTPTPSTPLYVDLSTGDLYVLLNNTVTLVGSIAGGSNYIIASQAFSNHSQEPKVIEDANQLLATRAFSSNQPSQQMVDDANQLLAMRSFSGREQAAEAIIGTASDLISQRVFRTGPQATTWMA